MDWEPVRPVREKIEAIDIDPENSKLVIIKIPLNINPKREWEYFFENPKALKGPIYSQKVRGDQIIVKANRKSPAEAVKQIFDYVESTNKRYKKFLDKNKGKYMDKEDKILEKITEKIRNEI